MEWVTGTLYEETSMKIKEFVTKVPIEEKINYKVSHPWVQARDFALFTLLYGCGLRISEALELDRSQWPFGDALKIRGKRSEMASSPDR